MWYSAVYISLHIAMLHTSIGVWYWVLVSLKVNITGYWVACLVSFQPYNWASVVRSGQLCT